MNTDNETSFQNMTWAKRREFVRGGSAIGAQSVIPFMRSKPGFRLLKPVFLVANAAAMLVIPIFFSALAKPLVWLMPTFALSMLTVGLWKRHLHWRDLSRGITWHTFSPGVGYVEKLPLPGFLRINRRTPRFVEPVLVWLVGLIVALCLCRALGAWIMVSATCLAIFENDVWESALNRELDIMDSLLTSEAQSRAVDFFSKKDSVAAQPSVVENEGVVSTGLSADLVRTIERKRAAKRLSPPDNMVPVMTQRA